MLDFIFVLILLFIVILSIELRKIYHEIPKKELKYRASHGDEIAKTLYRARAYDQTLDAFLWLVIALSSALSLILIDNIAPPWLGFIIIALIIWLSFAWLPRSKPSSLSTKLAIKATPVVAFILNYFHPVVKQFNKVFKKSFAATFHTKVYDKADLSELLTLQKQQQDNRISDEEIGIINRSMQLSEIKVHEVCLPWSKVKKVSATDNIGPVLLDELHKSGQTLIPVGEDKKAKLLVGILNLSKLDIGSTGLVSKAMESPVYYINEDDSLSSALKSFGIVNTPAFIVVDNQQNIVGLLIFNDIIEQLVGHIPGDTFDQYASLADVANKYNKKDEEIEETADIPEVEEEQPEETKE